MPGNNTNQSFVPLFNFSYEEAFDIVMSHSWPRTFGAGAELLIVVFYALLTVIGVACNTIVCYVIGRRRQRRIARNLYVLNLALSDLTLSVLCTPFTLIVMLQRTWTFGGFLCRLLPVVQGANIFVSAATIAVIAIDRFFAIVKPGTAMQSTGLLWRRRYAIVVCLTVWMVSVTLTLPLAFFQEVEEVEFNGVVLWCICVERWPSPRLRRLYTVAVMLVQYVIPTAVLTTTHLQITRHLRNRGVGSSNTRQKVTPPLTAPSKRNINELARYKRATMTLVVIAVVFAASWLPLHVFSLLADFELAYISSDSMYAIFAGCHSLAMTTACSNPVLYGALNTNFRREVTKLLNRKLIRLPLRRLGFLPKARSVRAYLSPSPRTRRDCASEQMELGPDRVVAERDSDVGDHVAIAPETSPSGT